MTSRIFKNISVLFLWLSGFIFIAHSVIPHDHHNPDTFSHQDEKCPASDNKSGHHSAFPIHCHAFNDLTSEKSKPYHLPQNIQFSFFAFVTSVDRSGLELQVSCYNIIDLQKPVFTSYALELYLLRAPPALV
jgi:hypothetical protein